MRVITLPEPAFREACHLLADRINAAGKDYALAVGVITGGARVADHLLPWLAPVEREDILFQRPGTARKDANPLIFRILRKLPRFVSNWMRMAESEYLSRTSRRVVSRHPEISSGMEQKIKNISPGGSVLVIDDSVDTGATVASVLDALRKINPEINFEVAAITVTMHNPMVTPDFTLYPARTLIRFPWSKDF